MGERHDSPSRSERDPLQAFLVCTCPIVLSCTSRPTHRHDQRTARIAARQPAPPVSPVSFGDALARLGRGEHGGLFVGEEVSGRSESAERASRSSVCPAALPVGEAASPTGVSACGVTTSTVKGVRVAAGPVGVTISRDAARARRIR